MRIVLFSAFSLFSQQGNTLSLLRLKQLLAHQTWHIDCQYTYFSPQNASLFIGFNALRSAKAQWLFHQTNPSGRSILVLTGTELYAPAMAKKNSSLYKALQRASALVVLQPNNRFLLPQRLQAKTHCIFPSVMLPQGLTRPSQQAPFGVMAGNVRFEKNIALLWSAQSLNQKHPPILYCGQGLGAYQKLLKKIHLSKLPFHLKGPCSHEETLQLIARSSFFLNTSLREGVSNALCEAVGLGIPVLASAIEGNRALLGKDYAGYFSPTNPHELSYQLQRIHSDSSFRSLLKKQIRLLMPQLSPERERQEWIDLLTLKS